MRNCKAMWLAESQQLFAIQHRPTRQASPTGALILNAGLLHNVGPFRLHVLLGDALSEAGFVVTRLDQSGKGESARRRGVKRNDSLLQDYDDALNSMAAEGVRQVVIIGLCSGADDGTFIAENRDSVMGLVSLDGFAQRNFKFYLRDYASRIFRPRAFVRIMRKLVRRFGRQSSERTDLASLDIRDWANDEQMLQRFANLMERGGKVLSVFTAGQDYYNYHGQLADNLRGKVALDNVEEDFHPKVDHTFFIQQHRTDLVLRIRRWFESNF